MPLKSHPSHDPGGARKSRCFQSVGFRAIARVYRRESGESAWNVLSRLRRENGEGKGADLDDDLARRGFRSGNVLEFGLSLARYDDCLHCCCPVRYRLRGRRRRSYTSPRSPLRLAFRGSSFSDTGFDDLSASVPALYTARVNPDDLQTACQINTASTVHQPNPATARHRRQRRRLCRIGLLHRRQPIHSWTRPASNLQTSGVHKGKRRESSSSSATGAGQADILHSASAGTRHSLSRHRWLHRATWTQTELFMTFPPASLDQTDDGKPAPSPGLKSISLVPRNRPDTGGRFRVWLLLSGDQDHSEGGPYAASAKGKERWRGWQLVWDRKIEGRFPEMKELVRHWKTRPWLSALISTSDAGICTQKQRIRNLIAPQQNLGHSDKPVSRPSADHQGAPSVPTPPSNTSAERHSSVPPRIAADNETSEKPGIDLAGLADQPLQPLTAADFEPKYRCM